MENTTRIIRINSKIVRALERIMKENPNDEIRTKSELANYILEWYIKQMYTNGNDLIDRD